MAGPIDITPVLSSRLAVWPGDVPFRLEADRAGGGGGAVVSSVRTTLHAGAHVDAPSHVLPGGATVDRVPLGVFVGPCQVVEARVPADGRVRPGDLAAPVRSPRVLLKTGSCPDPEHPAAGFAGISPGLAELLADGGAVLLGIDTPSVDPDGDESLAAHRALARRGVVGLEGLLLGHVPPGLYTLVALPLRLEGAEASPVRAVLIPGDEGEVPLVVDAGRDGDETRGSDSAIRR